MEVEGTTSESMMESFHSLASSNSVELANMFIPSFSPSRWSTRYAPGTEPGPQYTAVNTKATIPSSWRALEQWFSATSDFATPPPQRAFGNVYTFLVVMIGREGGEHSWHLAGRDQGC